MTQSCVASVACLCFYVARFEEEKYFPCQSSVLSVMAMSWTILLLLLSVRLPPIPGRPETQPCQGRTELYPLPYMFPLPFIRSVGREQLPVWEERKELGSGRSIIIVLVIIIFLSRWFSVEMRRRWESSHGLLISS